MKIDKLLELLTLLEGVNVHKWKMVESIVKSIQSEDTKIISKEWKKSTPLDLFDIRTWSTYDTNCIDLYFYVKDNKLYCSVKIFDGDMLYGFRTELRFKTELKLPKLFIIEISEHINYKFDRYLEARYEVYLDSKKQQWISKLRNKILKSGSYG